LDVRIEPVVPRPVAAVRRRMRQAEIAQKFSEPLDLVWAFVRREPGLLDRGRNIFIYSHPSSGNVVQADAMEIDFGVEVTRGFPDMGDASEVRCVHLPSGRAATALHIGPYHRLIETHAAVRRFCAANGHAIGERSWETYGHWSDDPAKLETWVSYLLK
jgi:AraC family transcriptional regulator